MPKPSLTITQVDRRYVQGESTLDILRAADLAIWPGQSVALVAPSGAGKSTLLHVAGLLEKPDGGEVFVGDAPTAAMADAARTALRRTRIGFVYQAHHLLAEMTPQFWEFWIGAAMVLLVMLGRGGLLGLLRRFGR